MSNMTPKKTFITIFSNINQAFPFLLLGKLMYELPDNGLKTEILTYSVSIDSVTQPDPSLIQLSVLYKIS